MTKHGNLSEFNADTEDDWPSYIEQINHANDITDDGNEKKISILMSSCGAPT